jgi:hypothetical protein
MPVTLPHISRTGPTAGLSRPSRSRKLPAVDALLVKDEAFMACGADLLAAAPPAGIRVPSLTTTLK